MQGHTGGVLTSTEWEVPTGSSVTVGGLNLSCSHGVRTAQRRAGGTAVAVGRYRHAPTQVNCCVGR